MLSLWHWSLVIDIKKHLFNMLSVVLNSKPMSYDLVNNNDNWMYTNAVDLYWISIKNTETILCSSFFSPSPEKQTHDIIVTFLTNFYFVLTSFVFFDKRLTYFKNGRKIYIYLKKINFWTIKIFLSFFLVLKPSSND